MVWVRKVFVYLLSLVFFVSLIGLALSTSANLAFSHPDKIENWLNQSDFYGHFVSNAIDQAKKSAGSSQDQGTVTLSDSAVQQAAQSAFSTQLLQQSVKIFLDGNYSWLEGKTAQPTFVIDFTSAKQSFTNQVAQYVQTHLAGLPVCTTQQLVAIGNVENIDPLNATCRPAALSAQAEAAIVTQRINTGDFLSNPVLTANNINPNAASQTKPYYQKFSSAPKLYQLGVKLPWIYGVLSLLCALGMVFISLSKRKGLRRVAVGLAGAGVVLVATKFVSDSSFSYLQKHIFNNSSIGQLQQALTTFLHLVEHQLVKIEFWFGIAFLVLAIIIFVALWATRNRARRLPKPTTADSEKPASTTTEETPQNTPHTPPTPTTPPRPTPTGPPKLPKPPKRTRLIQ